MMCALFPFSRKHASVTGRQSILRIFVILSMHYPQTKPVHVYIFIAASITALLLFGKKVHSVVTVRVGTN